MLILRETREVEYIIKFGYLVVHPMVTSLISKAIHRQDVEMKLFSASLMQVYIREIFCSGARHLHSLTREAAPHVSNNIQRRFSKVVNRTELQYKKRYSTLTLLVILYEIQSEPRGYNQQPYHNVSNMSDKNSLPRYHKIIYSIPTENEELYFFFLFTNRSTVDI